MSNESASREQLLSAIERTIGSESARIEFRLELSFPEDFGAPESSAGRRNDGSAVDRLKRQFGSAFWRAFAWGVRRLVDRWSRQMAAQHQVGVIDFAGHRCMYGPYKVSRQKEEAVLVVEDRLWRGAPGTAVARRAGESASALQPLWLVDLVRGVADARVQGEEVLDGHRCRRFAAHADLNRAAESLSYQMALPPAGISRLGELKEVPVELWVDHDGYIRRIRHTAGGRSAGLNTTILDLSEFGIQLPLDWSRLPSRRPG